MSIGASNRRRCGKLAESVLRCYSCRRSGRSQSSRLKERKGYEKREWEHLVSRTREESVIVERDSGEEIRPEASGEEKSME